MTMLVSLIVLLRGFPCFHDFSHAPSHQELMSRIAAEDLITAQVYKTVD